MVRNAIWIAIVVVQIAFLWAAWSLFHRSDLDICAGSGPDAEPACRRVLAQADWTAGQKAGAHLRLAELAGLDMESAVDHRAEALALDPSSTDLKSVATQAHELGTARLSQGSPESALKYLSLAIRLDPANHLALSARAKLHESQSRPDLALDDWRMALRLRPDDQAYTAGIALAYQARARPTWRTGASRLRSRISPMPFSSIHACPTPTPSAGPHCLPKAITTPPFQT